MGRNTARTGRRRVGGLISAVLLTATVWSSSGTSEATAPGTAAVVAPPSGARPIVVRGTTWYVRDALSGGPATSVFAFGAAGDTPVSGDWDGNGTDTPGVVRGNTWFLRNSNTGGPADISFTYGTATDIPVVGDWDGNGSYTPGIVRGNTWFLRNSNSSGSAQVTFNFGQQGDIRIAGDWDGNGTFTPGVARGTSWFLRNSNTGGAADVNFAFGAAGDRPIVGDWDGNGTTTPGVLRGATWFLRNANSGGSAQITFAYGRACDVAVSSESALVRQWGGQPLRASLVGTEMTKLPTSAKVVALTFDAGANANGVPSILATLRGQCIPATFFLTGEWTRDFPAMTRDIGLSYPVGNHTDTHPHLPQLSDAAVQSQINVAQSAIHGTTRYDTRPMFRFPFGESDARTLGIVNNLGYTSVRWTVDTAGWRGTSGGASVDTIMARVLGGLQPGEIILMHVGSNPQDGSTLDADALPRIISELKARGYSFVTVPPYL